jgi:methylenetetrahydrofolate reductase (NADPH)
MSDQIVLDPSFEVIPLKGISEKMASLAPASRVTVTASPAKGMAATLSLASDLHQLGFMVTPHLSARLIRDRSELEEIIDRMASEGIKRAFVVGGDGDERGKFKDALHLLRTMEELGHHFAEIGITGYPEGHPYISGDLLREALIAKQRHATYIATQMCFDPKAIFDWARGVRNAGVRLPIRVGIPGVVDPVRLASIAARIGVGTSLRFVMKNRTAIWRLLRPGMYKPTRLVKALQQKSEELGLSGLHIFTFNQVEATAHWYKQALTR